MSNATAAISPIKIASVFSTSSFWLLSTAERKKKIKQLDIILPCTIARWLATIMHEKREVSIASTYLSAKIDYVIVKNMSISFWKL